MKKIKFTKQFSSPVLGNVWIGRTLECKDYDKYINSGLAELIVEQKEKPVVKAKENVVNKPKRSKKPSKGR